MNLCIHIPFKENSACKNYSNTRGKLLFARLFLCRKFARLGSCIMDLLFKPYLHIMALYMASDSQVMFSHWHFFPICALSVCVCCMCMCARHETKLPLGIDPFEKRVGRVWLLPKRKLANREREMGITHHKPMVETRDCIDQAGSLVTSLCFPFPCFFCLNIAAIQKARMLILLFI